MTEKTFIAGIHKITLNDDKPVETVNFWSGGFLFK